MPDGDYPTRTEKPDQGLAVIDEPAEAAAREAQGIYLALLNATDQGFCTIEMKFDDANRPVDYRFLEVSPSFEGQTGIKNAAGRWMRDIAPDQDQFWFDIYGRVALTGQPEQFENFSTPLDRWFSVYALKIHGSGRVGILFDDITDRKRAEAALRESEERHSLLIGSWAQAVWETDAHGVVIADSPSWRAYTGQTLQEWLGYGWLNAIHPDDRAYAERQWREATAAHEIVNAEFRLLAPDGGWRWTNVRAVPVLNDKGDIEKWAGMNISIDARKRAEAALRDVEDRQAFQLRLSDALASLSDPADIQATAACLVAGQLGVSRCYFNEFDDRGTHATVLGDFHRDGLASMVGVHDLSGERDFLDLMRSQAMLDMSDLASSEQFSAEAKAAYGALGIRSALGAPLLRNGRLAAVLLVADISVRRWTRGESELLRGVAERTWAAIQRAHTEVALQESQEQFEALLHHAPLGVYLVDGDFVIRQVNPVALPVFGEIPGGPIGRDFDEVIHILWDKDYADEVVRIFRHTLDTGEPYVTSERAEYRADRNVIEYYEWRLDRIPLSGGKFAVVCYFRDISAQVQARKEIEKAHEAARADELRQAFLLKLSDVLRSIADPLEIQTLAMRVLGEQLEIVGAQYYESNDNGEHFNSFGGYTDGSVAKVKRVRLDDFGSFTKEAYRAGQTLVVDDVWHDERITPEQAAAYKALGVCAYVGVPLIKADRLVVALGAVHSAPKRWTKDEIALVEETAQRTWAAVERARAEAALRASEARGRDVLENMSEAFVLLDHDFRIVDLNAEAMRLEERPREAIVGKTHWDAHPDAAPELGDLYRLAMTERREVTLDHRYVWPHGRDTWLAMRAFPVGDGLAIFYRDVTDRKVASEALRESEARYRALATVGSSTVYRMSPDWREMRELDGAGFVADSDEPTTDWIETYLPADERPRVAEAIERAIRAKDVFELEHRVFRVDGTVGWTFSRAIPLLDDGGEVLEWFGVASDVTERVKADQSFTRLFEASPAPFLVLSPDPPYFTITEVNDAYLAATMRTREELVGRALFDAFPDNPNEPTPTSVSRLRASLEQVLASCQPDRLPGLKYDIRRPDGTFEERWWSPVNSPILDENGEVEAIIHNANDVTEDRRAEARLRESEARYRTLFETIDEGFCVIEFIDGPHGPLSDYVHVEANPAYTANAGIPDIVGQRLREIVSESEADAWAEIYRRVLTTGEPVRFERELVETGRHLDLSAFRVEPASRRQVAVLFQDISSRKLAETELRDSERHQSLLLAELQHRVRNILTMVRSVARRTADNCEDVDDYVCHLDGRLAALARVQAILTRDPGRGVDLHDMVLDELESQTASPDHYRIKGPDIELPPKAAEVLSLAIHELATNSTKYGVLSVTSGIIRIHWTVEDRDGRRWLRWTWNEPVVASTDRPQRTGFGTELIRHRVPYELRGTGEMRVGDDQVEATIDFPLAERHDELNTVALGKDIGQ